jgi:hypothetical protein
MRAARIHRCGGGLSPIGREPAAATAMRAAAALRDMGVGAIFGCEASILFGRSSALQASSPYQDCNTQDRRSCGCVSSLCCYLPSRSWW